MVGALHLAKAIVATRSSGNGGACRERFFAETL